MHSSPPAIGCQHFAQLLNLLGLALEHGRIRQHLVDGGVVGIIDHVEGLRRQGGGRGRADQRQGRPDGEVDPMRAANPCDQRGEEVFLRMELAGTGENMAARGSATSMP